jgi:hypothetical protein
MSVQLPECLADAFGWNGSHRRAFLSRSARINVISYGDPRSASKRRGERTRRAPSMKIAPGTILMKEGTHLPESVRVSRKACWSGWIAIKSLDPLGLGKQLREVGWTFHFLAGSVRKSAFGFDSETRFDRAMSSAIKYLQAEKYNCVEFDQMTKSRSSAYRTPASQFTHATSRKVSS